MKFSKNEYNVLRTELQERIQLLNTTNINIISVTITTWSISFILFGNIIETEAIDYRLKAFLYLIQAIILSVPLFCMVPLSLKARDNIEQISSIGAYLEIFHEIKSMYSEEVYHWEMINSKYTELNGDSKISRYINIEYTVISILSILLYTSFTLLAVVKVWNDVYTVSFIISLGVTLLILMIYLLINISKDTQINKIMGEKRQIQRRNFLKEALSINYISKDEYETYMRQFKIEEME